MHSMSHTMPYSWMELIFCAFFTASTLFYLFRLLSPQLVKAKTGNYDWENELWHTLCLLGMANCFAPSAWQLPSFLLSSLYFTGTIWYFVRANTWGQWLPHNKQWYDYAHAGMLLGMWWMYVQPISGIVTTFVNAAFWTWFASYYVFATYRDCKNFKVLTFGQNTAHLTMAAAMLAMTFAPSFFMPGHVLNAQATTTSTNCLSVDESNFKQEITNSQLPVLAIVFGGCEKCQIELHIFRELAPEYAGKIKFVTVNEDNAPKCKQALGINQCPTVLIVNKGKTLPIQSIQNKDDLRNQLSKFLNP